ncbi:putative membrane protein [Clostridium bornimense]|uniref:Putative membrane protein n=1 Tax=Clostridium bornimense TaxID=1216932 RepID=W6SKP4_9CLOT|nr:hypothetical protein [Clostridium bornimense]CDM70490.1 putative membrane protein [Clostridium bornimense]
MESRIENVLNRSKQKYVFISAMLSSIYMFILYIVVAMIFEQEIFSDMFILVKLAGVLISNILFFTLEYNFLEKVNNNAYNSSFKITIRAVILYGVLAFGINLFILSFKTFTSIPFIYCFAIDILLGIIVGLIMYNGLKKELKVKE